MAVLTITTETEISMPNEHDLSRPPKKGRLWLRVLLVLVAIFALCVLGVLFDIDRREHFDPLVISKETTHLTEPLNEFGFSDYRTAINEEGAKGVTPENNLAVALIEIVGPEEFFRDMGKDQFYIDDLCARLGVDRAVEPVDAPFLVELEDFVRGSVDVSDMEFHELATARERAVEAIAFRLAGKEPPVRDDEQEEHASSGYGGNGTGYAEYGEYGDENHVTPAEGFEAFLNNPAGAGDIPLFEQWIARHDPLLDRLVEASNRERYFFPVERRNAEEPHRLDCPGLNAGTIVLSRVARLLHARAALNARRGDHAAACRDFRAAFRLEYRSFLQGRSLDEVLDSDVYLARFAKILHDGDWTVEQIAEMRAGLDALPPPDAYAVLLDRRERFLALNSLCAAHHDVRQQVPPDPDDDLVERWIKENGCDWNLVARDFNAYVDDIVAAIRTDAPEEYERLSDRAYLVWSEADVYYAEDWGDFRDAVYEAGSVRDMANSTMLWLMMMHLSHRETSTKFDVQRTLILLRAALALTAYRAEHGAYPERLEDLVPKHLDAAPYDPVYDEPFVYRREDDGATYVLFNKSDEGEAEEFYDTPFGPKWLEMVEERGKRMEETSGY